jgi:hypothetical protein
MQTAHGKNQFLPVGEADIMLWNQPQQDRSDTG